MTTCSRAFQFGLGMMVMAALTGLLGFAVIYHYATFERPVRHFAIVVDAGSTQTRSGLFAIELEAEELEQWMLGKRQLRADSLESVFKARQVGACVNGRPLASLQSEWEARQLIGKCLREFLPKIKHPEFYDTDQEAALADARELENDHLEADSITHIYLGATAGMRALSELNATRASEKIRWIERAIDDSHQLVGPYINKGFVGVLEGADEAAFGWSSVNFVCGRLDKGEPTIGTLELGGASAQMAHQLGDIGDSASKVHEIELFERNYTLDVRSELCLGASQANLRTNFLVLKNHHEDYNTSQQDELDLVHPCLQRGMRLNISDSYLAQLFKEPCLQTAIESAVNLQSVTNNGKRAARFVGTGNYDQCAKLLDELVEPANCRKHFLLCPASKNTKPPPPGMSFVTISSYNKALKALDLKPEPIAGQHVAANVISERLGGRSINYTNYIDSVLEFCSTRLEELPSKYPNAHPDYYHMTCMQLVYIDKLLNEFYLFNSPKSWAQIKFLLFDPEPQSGNKRDDISWTLGLLLNATSEQFTGHNDATGYVYHHSSSIMHVLRTTVLLMFACVLVAICLIVSSFLFSHSSLLRKTSGIYIPATDPITCSSVS